MTPRRPCGWLAGLRALAPLAAAVLVGAVACARPGTPTGGREDRFPPVVVSVEPDTFAQVEPGTDRIRIRFNERISEQTTGGPLDQAVRVSPRVGEVEVSHRRDGLDVEVEGGFEGGRVYRIRLDPVIRDMFGNAMSAPFEWAFSTGGEYTANVVVGQLWDRTTGDGVEGGRVRLTPEADSVVFEERTDGDGLFALRFLPPGGHSVLAFVDRNGNDSLDAGEARGRLTDSLGVSDTLFVSLSVLAPDTTGPVLARVNLLDSLTLRLVFDDFLDPGVGPDLAWVELRPDTAAETPADTGVLPEPAALYHEGRWARYQDSLAQVADSLRARAQEEAAAQAPPPEPPADALAGGDSVAVDTLGAPAAAGRPGGPPAPPAIQVPGLVVAQEAVLREARDTLPDGTDRPQPSLVLVVAEALPPGVGVAVVMEGPVNLSGLAGGGEAGLIRPAPVADTLPADTLPADTLPGDTAAVAGPQGSDPGRTW